MFQSPFSLQKRVFKEYNGKLLLGRLGGGGIILSRRTNLLVVWRSPVTDGVGVECTISNGHVHTREQVDKEQTLEHRRRPVHCADIHPKTQRYELFFRSQNYDFLEFSISKIFLKRYHGSTDVFFEGCKLRCKTRRTNMVRFICLFYYTAKHTIINFFESGNNNELASVKN